MKKMGLKDRKQIFRNRRILIKKLLEEVNSKDEYNDLLQEQKEVEKVLKFLMKIKCPKCGSTMVEILSDDTILCKKPHCLSVNILESQEVRKKMKGGRRKKKNGFNERKI